MKKNYFCGLLKSFGILPILVLTGILFLAGFSSVNPTNFALSAGNSTVLANVMVGALYAVYVGIVVIGCSDLKSKKVTFTDLLRISGFLSSLAMVIVIALKEKINVEMLGEYCAITALLLVEIVVRIVLAKVEEDNDGIKKYFSALANKFNPLAVAAVGVVAGVVFFALYSKLTAVTTFLSQYGVGLAFGLVGVTMVSAAIKKDSKTNLLDALLSAMFYALVVAFIFALSKFESTTFKAVAVLLLATTAAILCRGASYTGSTEKTSKVKMNAYYADLYSKYDVCISVLVGALLVGFFVIPAFNSTGWNMVLSGYGIPVAQFKTVASVLGYVVSALCLVLIVLLFVFRKFKNEDITHVDKVVNILGYVALFTVPYLVFVCLDFKANLDVLTNTISLLVTTICLVVVAVFALIFQCVRYVHYLVAEEENEEVEEAVQEEAPQEEVVEEIQEEEAPEEVVEEIEEEEVSQEEPEEAVEEIEEEAEEEEVIYVDEEGNPVDMSEVEEEAEESTPEEEVEEVIEEEVEEEPVSKEKDVIIPEVSLVDENGQPKKIKRRFNTRMMFAPYEAKEYYNEIKNYLLMYRAKGRNSARCETFRYRGLVAKVALAGKSIKVCLAIDPTSLEGTKYRYKDVSEKRQYAEVPTMIKVRSARGLKYFKELVDIMMAARGVKPKRNFQPTNYLPQLIPNGEAILATLGMSTDYLYPSMNARGIPAELPDDLENYLPVIQGDELEEEEVEATVYLDTLCNHFEDGEEVTIDVLKQMHIVTKGNVIRVKARGTLDRKIIVYAEYFEPDALKMLMCTNCTAIKIVR